MKKKNSTPKKKDLSIVKYFKDSISELSKVTWLTQHQAVKLTIIVFGFCIAAAFSLGAIDYLLSFVHKKYLLGI